LTKQQLFSRLKVATAEFPTFSNGALSCSRFRQCIYAKYLWSNWSDASM